MSIEYENKNIKAGSDEFFFFDVNDRAESFKEK
jgi:hypothetical protein